MDSRDLQARLREISRGRATQTSGAESLAPTWRNRRSITDEPADRRPAARIASRDDRPIQPSASSATPLAPPSAELRGSLQQNGKGQHLWMQTPLEQVWPSGAHWLARLVARWQDYGHLPEEAHDEMDAVQRFFPERVFFLDLETCGLAGSMIFLAGLVHHDGGRLVLSQLWARNYAEEAALLTTLWQIVRSNRVLVTFNGKSFDWTQVQDRSTLYRLGTPKTPGAKRVVDPPRAGNAMSEIAPDDPRPDPIHCDLLHHARRLWKDRLPDCRLQTLERFVCGRRRRGDIPGRDIPDVYHDYVRTGESKTVKSVLHHNALDLITLLQLTMQIVMSETGGLSPQTRAGSI